MKVKELIEKLQTLDSEQTIACYTNDEGLRDNTGPVQIFEIVNIQEIDAESSRLEEGQGKPQLKFGKSSCSSKYVLLELTSDV